MNYNELKDFAESNNFEIQQLANELEMSPNGFRESIKNETIQLKKLKKLCKTLNISLNDFADSNAPKEFSPLNQKHKDESSLRMALDNKEREVELLKQRIADKDEIIRLLRQVNSNQSGYGYGHVAEPRK